VTGWQVLPDRLEVGCGDVHVVLASVWDAGRPGDELAREPGSRRPRSRSASADWRQRVLSGVLNRMHAAGFDLTEGPLLPSRTGAGRAAPRPCIAVAGSGQQLAMALSTRVKVEISVQAVPGWVDETTCQTLTRSEIRLLDGVPVAARGETAARIWTRKDAALRLTGDCIWGAMRGAMTVARGAAWNVVVPAADGSTCRAVDVYDLPRCDGSVAALASDTPPGRIFTWLWPE
jgi:hypothetical protein